MVRHIVTLNFTEGFNDSENRANAKKVKQKLEALKDVIPGIIEFRVIIDCLPSGNRDIVFNTLFESVEALAAYQVHPAHLEVAAFVASVMRNRTCVDYFEGEEGM